MIILPNCRPEEIARLRKRNVYLDAGMMHIRHGKSAAAKRSLRLTAESKAILARRMDSAGPWVFPSDRKPGHHIQRLNATHDRVLRKIGLSFVLYDLRHTFATRMVEAGVRLEVLK